MGLEPRESTGATASESTTESTNALFDLPSTKQTALWYHAAAGWPEEETFLGAIRKGNYATWPGLNVKMMSRHFPESIETKKGHMKGARQGIQSTKPTQSANIVDDGTIIKIKEETNVPQRYHTPRRTMYTSVKWKCRRQYIVTIRAQSRTHRSGAKRSS